MKVATLLRYPLFLEAKRFFDPARLADALYEERFDVAVVDFGYYQELKDIKDYSDAQVIFVDLYFDPLHLRRALEVGDYYFLYEEPLRIKEQIEYLRRKFYGGRIFRYKDLFFDKNKSKLYKGNREIPLTKAERELLSLLTSQDVVRYDDVVGDVVSTKDSLKVLIVRLRKLGFEIASLKNVGYRLVKEESR